MSLPSAEKMIADALRELAAADAEYDASFHLPGHLDSDDRHELFWSRLHDATERVKDLAKTLFPQPKARENARAAVAKHAPKAKPKPPPSPAEAKRSRSSTSKTSPRARAPRLPAAERTLMLLPGPANDDGQRSLLLLPPAPPTRRTP